jgi:hypothetical protein
LNAYRIDIWRSVKHNDKFICNVQRVQIIHARNEVEAKSKIILKGETINNLPDLIIKVSSEFIYSCEKIGTVRIEPFYIYSNGRSSISVKEYKEQFNKNKIEEKTKNVQF